MMLLTGLILSALGRLQGSGSVWFMSDTVRDILKYIGTGIILTLFFTWIWVDTTGWTWQWAFLVFIAALIVTGKQRALGLFLYRYI